MSRSSRRRHGRVLIGVAGLLTMQILAIGGGALVSALPASAATATAADCNQYGPVGCVEVQGSEWAPASIAAAHNLNVYNNGSNLSAVHGSDLWGSEWQCTEFATRWADAAWGDGGYKAWDAAGWNGSAQNMYDVAPHLRVPLTRIPNGDPRTPQFGDLLIFGENPGPGHVAVVLGVNRSTGKLTFIGQNQYAAPAVVSIPISSGNTVSTAGFDSSLWVRGWLHGPGATPPTAPVVTLGTRTQSTVSLSWNASNATSYTIKRNGVAVGTTSSLSFTDSNLQASTFFRYQVVAAGNNQSAVSSVAVASTLAAADPRIDANGDGKTDLAYIYPGAYIDTFVSNGDGTYTEPVQSLPGFDSTTGIWLTGDFSGNHRTDLAYVYPGGYIDTFVSNGDGTYTEHTDSMPGFDSAGGTWMVTDANGDGKADLTYIYPGAYIDTFVSNGDGTYTEHQQSLPGFDSAGGKWL